MLTPLHTAIAQASCLGAYLSALHLTLVVWKPVDRSAWCPIKVVHKCAHSAAFHVCTSPFSFSFPFSFLFLFSFWVVGSGSVEVLCFCYFLQFCLQIAHVLHMLRSRRWGSEPQFFLQTLQIPFGMGQHEIGQLHATRLAIVQHSSRWTSSWHFLLKVPDRGKWVCVVWVCAMCARLRVFLFLFLLSHKHDVVFIKFVLPSWGLWLVVCSL